MANSAIVLGEFGTHALDQAPGAPVFVSIGPQLGNEYPVVSRMPSADFDGTALTGLKHYWLARGLKAGGVHPFEGLGVDEIKALPGTTLHTTDLTDADAGLTKENNATVLVPGETEGLAIWVDDDA